MKPADLRGPAPVVFWILRDTKCVECGSELPAGSFALMEKEQAICLPCARLADLEYLQSGNAAVTRRSIKYSSRSAVVVRLGRTRYERQGVLVEDAALAQAEHECVVDAGNRARQRERGSAQRQKDDGKFVAQAEDELSRLFPALPPEERRAIAEHSATRLARGPSGASFTAEGLTLATAAYIRHHHTRYDDLLAKGVDRVEARDQVREQVREILTDWESN